MSIHQPLHLPWLGYWHRMANVDVFVVCDTDQYEKSSSTYLQKQRVLGGDGEHLLAVAVRRPHGLKTRIYEAELDYTQPWKRKHRRTLEWCYSHTAGWEWLWPTIQEAYSAGDRTVAQFNGRLLRAIRTQLGLRVELKLSSDLQIPKRGRDEEILDTALALGATEVVLGPGSAEYLDRSLFRQAGLSVRFHRFVPVEYQQFGTEFVPGLSIVDAMFHLGKDATKVLGVSGEIYE